ncbi:MAG: thioredoxin domain-containing protein [Solirubrobacterales bacterium]
MGKSDRESRKKELREQRLAEEAKAQAVERRQRMLKFGAAAVLGAIVVVVAAILISQSGSGGGDSSVEGAADVNQLLAGVPHKEMVLGDPANKVEILEFGDLQCPVCKEYSESVIPQLISGPVSGGEAKLEFRNYIVIGSQSVDAGAAALAAGQQGRGWNFVELFYRNQGFENSGYVTDSFLESIAKAAGVPSISKWNQARQSAALRKEVKATTNEALNFGGGGTPLFVVRGPGGTKVLGAPGASVAPFEQAISQVG